MDKQISKPTGYLGLRDRKTTGAHYTPNKLSDFVAFQIINHLDLKTIKTLQIADPAVGDGELLESLAKNLVNNSNLRLKAQGFDIDAAAISAAKERMIKIPELKSEIRQADFIDYVLEQTDNNLFQTHEPQYFDAVIANPPYVRTQVLGAKKAQLLSKQFGLKGRVDLYHAFILGIAKLMNPGGILGIIVSNRFMTTKSGEEIRRNILDLFDIIHIWDFGDTQLFDAAVLPAVLLLRRKNQTSTNKYQPKFTSIYSVNNVKEQSIVSSVFDAVLSEGIIQVTDKGVFKVKQGRLDANGVWKISNKEVDDWVKKVDIHTKMLFSDIGKIRVGVKTTADNVFINGDWTEKDRPELLQKLTTHHVARRYKPLTEGFKYILYPHESVNGTRSVINIDKFPKSKKYLNKHKDQLGNRKYVIEAGRKWYEIWVPQDPKLWSKPKIVFRDISEKPTFWLDLDGTIVNGDCYWVVSDHGDNEILWLVLAVANSRFIESFYDHKFNNKLYSGRRRFISQYVEKFPLPDPKSDLSLKIIELSKKIFDTLPENVVSMENEIDELVWRSFGFSDKEVTR